VDERPGWGCGVADRCVLRRAIAGVSETARRGEGEGESRALGAAAWATGTTAASKQKRWTVVLRRSGRCEVRRGGRQGGRAPAERVIMPASSQNGDDYDGRDIALLAGLQMAALCGHARLLGRRPVLYAQGGASQPALPLPWLQDVCSCNELVSISIVSKVDYPVAIRAWRA
jgi:hypothetical protein